MLVKQVKTRNIMVKVFYDDSPSNNPREWDNLGHMICWHRNYNLGDEHDYSDPLDMAIRIVERFYDYEEIVELAKSRVDKNDNCYLILDTICGDWHYDNDEYEYLIIDIENNPVDFLSEDEIWEMVYQKVVILPLYLYDHSGVTMNTGGFSCPWDSGQVGYIYTSHEDIERVFGEVTDKTIKQVTDILKAEVDIYDAYIRGECYGCQILELEQCKECGAVHENLTDSCWGFVGDLKHNGILDYIQSQLEESVAQELVGELIA